VFTLTGPESLKPGTENQTIWKMLSRKAFDSTAERRKHPFFHSDPRADPDQAGVPWGNRMWSIAEDSILCQGGVWEEEELKSHRLFGHLCFGVFNLLF